MTGPALTRPAALDMYATYLALPHEVVSCQVCSHPWPAHYGVGGSGCVACETGGPGCPAYVPGVLPHQITRHLDVLGPDPAPCPWLCGHPAGRHNADSGCLSCGCRYDMPDATAPPGVTYHGYPADDARGHRIVVIEAPAGTPVTLLPEISQHSPTGFAWGYGGRGPAALARSLLVSVLGPAAICPACQGHRKVAWDPATRGHVPYWELAEADAGLGDVRECEDCDDGYREDLPYQDFKEAVITLLPAGAEWVLGRAEILRWLAAAAPAAHAAAIAALPEERVIAVAVLDSVRLTVPAVSVFDNRPIPAGTEGAVLEVMADGTSCLVELALRRQTADQEGDFVQAELTAGQYEVTQPWVIGPQP